MTSFEEWFAAQGSEQATDIEELPEGVIYSNAEYLMRCCCCEEYKPLYIGLDEIPVEGYKHYCGGSPRCCP